MKLPYWLKEFWKRASNAKMSFGALPGDAPPPGITILQKIPAPGREVYRDARNPVRNDVAYSRPVLDGRGARPASFSRVRDRHPAGPKRSSASRRAEPDRRNAGTPWIVMECSVRKAGRGFSGAGDGNSRAAHWRRGS